MSRAETIESLNPFVLTRLPLSSGRRQLQLGLSYPTAASPGYWRAVEMTKSTRSMQVALFRRDRNACRFCGFVSNKYQDLVARDGRDWDLDAVATACHFCWQCLMLDRVNEMRSGVLLRLPEIAQTDLHQIARVIYICRISQGSAADKARALLDRLMKRREAAREAIGSDNPDELAKRLSKCPSAERYFALQRELQDIRLFPLDRRITHEAELEFNMFPQILAYWRSKDGPFAKLPPRSMDLSEFDRLLAAGI